MIISGLPVPVWATACQNSDPSIVVTDCLELELEEIIDASRQLAEDIEMDEFCSTGSACYAAAAAVRGSALALEEAWARGLDTCPALANLQRVLQEAQALLDIGIPVEVDPPGLADAAASQCWALTPPSLCRACCRNRYGDCVNRGASLRPGSLRRQWRTQCRAERANCLAGCPARRRC